jgi:exodeoxyribonuclease V beta subunit
VGQVLGMTADHGASDLEKTLQQLAARGPGIALEPAPEPTGEALKPGERQPRLERIERFQGVPLERWWVASYSALQHEAGRQTPPDSARDEDYLEEAPSAQAPLRKPPEQRSVHDFLRGPMAGTFLHGLLEVLADEGFDASLDDDSAFAEALHQRLTVRRWEDWYPLLQHWMTELVRTPLPLHGTEAALKDLGPNQYRPELEFLFPAHRVSAGELDRVIRRHVLPGQERPALQNEQLNGMLKGFIDLVFEQNGRYYVMDYKSNHLGVDDSAYTQAAMRETVLEKRYDVQYSLYLLALHRLLQSRLGDQYDYDSHIGGCAYYFLRGIGAESRGLHFERPPKELMEELDQLFRGDATHAA